MKNIGLGFILGCAFLYCTIFLLSKFYYLAPEFTQYLPHYHQHLNHNTHGKVLQKIYISDEDYQSSEGNEAILSKINNSCQITVHIYGESGLYHKTFFFKNNKISVAFATDENYPNGGFYTYLERPNAFDIEQTSLDLKNVTSQKTQNEFDKLIKFFKPNLIQNC